MSFMNNYINNRNVLILNDINDLKLEREKQHNSLVMILYYKLHYAKENSYLMSLASKHKSLISISTHETI